MAYTIKAHLPTNSPPIQGTPALLIQQPCGLGEAADSNTAFGSPDANPVIPCFAPSPQIQCPVAGSDVLFSGFVTTGARLDGASSKTSSTLNSDMSSSTTCGSLPVEGLPVYGGLDTLAQTPGSARFPPFPQDLSQQPHNLTAHAPNGLISEGDNIMSTLFASRMTLASSTTATAGHSLGQEYESPGMHRSQFLSRTLEQMPFRPAMSDGIGTDAFRSGVFPTWSPQAARRALPPVHCSIGSLDDGGNASRCRLHGIFHTQRKRPTVNPTRYHFVCPQCTTILTAFFKQCPYPTAPQKKDLLRMVGMERHQLDNWFCNKRRKKPEPCGSPTSTTPDGSPSSSMM
ncbi:homeobox protein homothorax-like [Sycon ciliatum]|uniref:homeobox protein homothorax-like n=1 Tax=Sycon ciliatum TaxID=27933 RepID=UPI0031F60933